MASEESQMLTKDLFPPLKPVC